MAKLITAFLVTHKNSKGRVPATCNNTVADPGEGPARVALPTGTLFLDQAEARRAEKEPFLRPAPHLISCRVPHPPYLKVWIRHCNILVSRINSLIPRLTLEAKQLVSVWVFQIEFVLFLLLSLSLLFSFPCKGSKGTNYTREQTGKTADKCRKYNFNCIVVGFSFLKEAMIASTNFRHNRKFSFLLYEIKRFDRITGVT